MFFGKPGRASDALFAALNFLLSGIMFYSWAGFEGIPDRSELRSASGSVSWVQDGKYGVKFRLQDVPLAFDYSSKSKAMDLVHEALTRPDRPIVTVLYDPKSARGPIYSNDVYYGVFELFIAGKPIRSHEQTAKAWQSDQGTALWLAAFFALGGGYLSWTAFGQRNRGH